jgi:glycosyltransferase involved in cell wall biosynthesis
MRILLDCHNLRGGPPGAEKRLFISRVAAILSERERVEWLFLVDRDYPDEFQGVGQSLPVRGTSRGRWLWKHWRLPRIVKKIVKKYKPDRVITFDEMEGIPGAADERYQPLAGEEKEEVKNGLTEGKEYFLADTGGMRKEQVVGLLKAFSLFKKRQRSNMRFVLRGREIPIDLEHYKYRSEICFCGDAGEEEWRRLVGAAYGLVLPSGSGGLTVFNAWKTETPVIDGDLASLAAQLMTLYTNEGLRAELIGKGRDRLRSYSWERSAGEVWDLVLAAGKSAINK